MDRCFPLVSVEAFCVWKALLTFPWWLRNDLHLLFINIVNFQGYGFSENTIRGTLVAAFSLRSPPGFSQMVLRTIEGSHGWDNDSRRSFHERTHHVDRLHSSVNILPWMEPFDKARFIQQKFTGIVFFSLQPHEWYCCGPSRAIAAAPDGYEVDRGALMVSCRFWGQTQLCWD